MDVMDRDRTTEFLRQHVKTEMLMISDRVAHINLNMCQMESSRGQAQGRRDPADHPISRHQEIPCPGGSPPQRRIFLPLAHNPWVAAFRKRQVLGGQQGHGNLIRQGGCFRCFNRGAESP
jgi:hypothetical protein